MIERDTVLHDMVVPITPQAAFDMFFDHGGLVLSIGVGSDPPGRRGGRFQFEATPGRFCEGEYLIVERPRRVAFTFGWTHPAMGVPPGSSHVDVTFRPVDPERRSTQLHLVHTGLDTDILCRHDEGWARFIAGLAATKRPQRQA